MKTVRDIVYGVGRDELTSALGFGKQAVSNAIAKNKFPSSWHAVVKSLADEAGIDVPESMFNGVIPAPKKGKDAA